MVQILPILGFWTQYMTFLECLYQSSWLCRLRFNSEYISYSYLRSPPNIISWSRSQILVYNENSVTLTFPLFTFPNTQQVTLVATTRFTLDWIRSNILYHFASCFENYCLTNTRIRKKTAGPTYFEQRLQFFQLIKSDWDLNPLELIFVSISLFVTI